MIDAELRGWLLVRFYDRRNSNGGSVPVDDIIVSGIEHVGREAIREVCEQLADVELIRWEPLTGANEGPVESMWYGDRVSPLEIRFPNKPEAGHREKENEPMSADKPREGTGPLSSWQGFLPPNPSGELVQSSRQGRRNRSSRARFSLSMATTERQRRKLHASSRNLGSRRSFFTNRRARASAIRAKAIRA